MAQGSYIDDRIWTAVIPDLEFDFDSPIYTFWRELRNDPATPNPGPPITPEIDTPVGRQQGFSSGMVIGFNDQDGAYIANG